MSIYLTKLLWNKLFKFIAGFSDYIKNLW